MFPGCYECSIVLLKKLFIFEMWRLKKGILKTSVVIQPFLMKVEPPKIRLDLLKFYSTSKVEKFEELRSFKSKSGIGGGWLLLVIPFSTFCLGTWQIKRKKWKENLIEDIKIKTRYPAIELPSDELEVEGLEYRKVHVRGKFDHSGEMYIGPRSLLKDGESSFNQKLLSARPNTSAGYCVVTPFEISDTKERILVNRGWVPMKKKSPRSRLQGQIEDEVELTGIVRLSEPRPSFASANDPKAKVWFSRDVELMSQVADTRPVFIEATEDSTVEGGPIGGQTLMSFRNEHLSYIITWYSLSAATAIMWYKTFIK